ncbi:MAG: hypothetical protein JSR32_03585 [Proteobacteria bacterium]|nr:hypothetical protein [Pseudomonadota bacterium]
MPRALLLLKFLATNQIRFVIELKHPGLPVAAYICSLAVQLIHHHAVKKLHFNNRHLEWIFIDAMIIDTFIKSECLKRIDLPALFASLSARVTMVS